ncbi:MAG: choice-of-anchor D domain-containing protein [Deltaproteobacteria bacterium]|nr:choice-of-anchor D domain-containing protein [Deltaproteobacteria bacterium]
MLEILIRRPSKPYAVWFLLCLGALPRCQCEEDQAFVPSASFDPASVLDFGDVPVDGERTLDVLVRSTGSASFCVTPSFSASEARAEDCVPEELGHLDQAGCPWRYDFDAALLEGLAPSATATISVTYRPCPEAWDGDTLKPDFDLSACNPNSESGELTIVEEGRACSATKNGRRSLSLLGRPVFQPSASVFCPTGGGQDCSAQDPTLVACSTLFFGEVGSGEPPCDLVVEVKNRWRDGRPVAPLQIDRVEIWVNELNEAENLAPREGAEAGFSVRDLTGARREISAEAPVVVPIEPNATTGAARFKVRFDGTKAGVWTGEEQKSSGMYIYTNDPDQPVIALSVFAQGTAPEADYYPEVIQFGPVRTGTTKTATVSLRNEGNADLIVTKLEIVSASSEFAVRTSLGLATPITLSGSGMSIYVDYTPADAGIDNEVLAITTNDASHVGGRIEIPLSGGALPKLQVEPSQRVVFANPEPPPAPPRSETITLSNIGFSDLTISKLDLVGPGGDGSHPSVDDFSIAGCAGFPCVRSDVLCAPGLNCQSGASMVLELTYKNTDLSTTDQVELRISSDDPSDPEHLLILSAKDVPCVYPRPIITVLTSPTCAGAPIRADATASVAGDSDDRSITDYEWFWVRTPGPAPVLTPLDGVETSFTTGIDDSGIYILGLKVRNDCGAWGLDVATETILVSDSCN